MKRYLVLILIGCTFFIKAQDVIYTSPFPKFIPYHSETVNDSSSTAVTDYKQLGLEQPARWLSVDPKADKYPGWSPYNYCLNNPLKNVDPDGKEVKVYTERLGASTLSSGGGPVSGSVAWLVGASHSFMRVTTDKYDYVIELGGPVNGSKKGNPLMTPVKGELQSRENQTECNVDRPQGVGEKDYSRFEDKIVALFNVIKDNLPDYNALGANCNGFIRFLIETNGGGVNLPANAYSSKDIKEYWEKYKQSLEKKKKEEEAKKK